MNLMIPTIKQMARKQFLIMDDKSWELNFKLRSWGVKRIVKTVRKKHEMMKYKKQFPNISLETWTIYHLCTWWHDCFHLNSDCRKEIFLRNENGLTKNCLRLKLFLWEDRDKDGKKYQMSPEKENSAIFPLAIRNSHSRGFQDMNILCRDIRFVISHFTFHNLQNKLYYKHSSHPSRMFHIDKKAHDENIKKIARKIQIHNAKRYVLLDKTFCAKRKENVNNIYYL